MTLDQFQAVLDRMLTQWPDDLISAHEVSDFSRVLENVTYVDAMRAIHELSYGLRPRSGDLAAAIGKTLRAEGRASENPDKTDYAALAAKGAAECRAILNRAKGSQ